MAKYEITVNVTLYTIEIGDVSSSPVQVVVNGEVKTVTFNEVQAKTEVSAPVIEKPMSQPVKLAPVDSAGTKITAPMPGKILSIKVKVGDQVKVDDIVCTLEAMKMEMPISSTSAGKVKAVHVAVGDNVAFNDPLISIE